MLQLESYELRYGKSNCSWASCREGCTAEIFKCHQLRVTYTPRIEFLESEDIENIDPKSWAHLTRTEKQVGFSFKSFNFKQIAIDCTVKKFLFRNSILLPKISIELSHTKGSDWLFS